MAGAIAGVYHGIDSIPEKWSSKCEGLHAAVKMAEALFNIVNHKDDDPKDDDDDHEEMMML